MDQITRGVRDLIRLVMRERGIKHCSEPASICTVCYAEQKERSIEYEGPVFISYDSQQSAIICLAVTHNAIVRRPPTLWLSQYRFGILKSEDFSTEVFRIDIHRPDFCDLLGSFLDKHIKEHNKRPAKWKKQYRDTDKEYCFIPDETAPEKPKFTLGKMFVAWVLQKWFNIDPYDIHFAWKNAIKRHFRVGDDEIEQIENTVRAIENTPKAEVEANTATILSNQWFEY